MNSELNNENFITTKFIQKIENKTEELKEPKLIKNDLHPTLNLYKFKNQSKYKGYLKNNLPNERGVLEFINGDKYIGNFKDGKYNDKGVYIWANGDKYEGDFINGEMNGYACITFKNGDTYDGAIFKGQKNGPGRYEEKNKKEIYNGNFENDICIDNNAIWEDEISIYYGPYNDGYKKGMGILKYKLKEFNEINKDNYDFIPYEYKGEFNYNNFEGKGRQIWIPKQILFNFLNPINRNENNIDYLLKNNSLLIYEGKYSKGKKEGEGTLIFPLEQINNSKLQMKEYIGNFKNDLFSGKGKLIWGTVNSEKKNIYTGNFLENKFNGKGHLIKEDGTVYEGEFADDEYNGLGKIIFFNGDQYDGEFKNGIINGYGKYNYTDGGYYTGNFRKGLKCGKGIEYFRKDINIPFEKYEGEYCNDRITGNGIMIYKNGEKYIGNFNKNLKHGKGKYFYKDGRIYDGDWFEDQKEGNGRMDFVYMPKQYYIGQWKNDKMNGIGTFIWEGLQRYEGPFLNDKQNGKGVIEFEKDHRVIDVIYENGKCVKRSDGIYDDNILL